MAGLDLTRLAADLRRNNTGPTNDMPAFDGLAARVRFDAVEALAAAIESQERRWQPFIGRTTITGEIVVATGPAAVRDVLVRCEPELYIVVRDISRYSVTFVVKQADTGEATNGEVVRFEYSVGYDC